MGTMTINTSAAEDARLMAAYGKVLNLGRNATGAEVKAAIIQNIIATVRNVERIDAAVAAESGVTPIAPT